MAVLALPLGFLGPKESTLIDLVPLVEQAAMVLPVGLVELTA